MNGPDLCGTLPGLVYGEGQTKSGGGHFDERQTKYKSGDLRLAARGDKELSVFVMVWPEQGRLTIHSLAQSPESRGVVERVELYGHPVALPFEQTNEGLNVQLPSVKPCDDAWVLRVTGSRLRDFAPEGVTAAVFLPDRDAHFVLNAADAEIHGITPKLETKPGGAKQNTPVARIG